jgi:hypothetical protein
VAETRELRAIVKAIVCLNFNEADQALAILLDALTDYNFESGKENANGNATYAA